MRLIMFFACCLVLCAACGAPALALAEFCPAEIEAPHQLDAKTGPSALFSYALRAESPRSVAGSAIFDTSMGWFEVEFPRTALTARAYRMQDEFVSFTRATFESDPLYVRFPQPVTIKGGYVASATSSGDQVLGWDAKGTVQCAPRAGFETRPTTGPKVDFLKTLNPRTDLDAMPSSNAAIAVAAITSAPGSTDCDVPFANATAEAASPEYPVVPENRAASVWVEVAVNADGTLADAWIYAPSGSRPFDAAALRAARLSKFKGGRVFCQAAGGDYLFHALFQP